MIGGGRPLFAVVVAAVAGGCPGGGTGSFDYDGDGSPDAVDCAPADPESRPGADDVCGDGIDQDCDGVDGVTGTWCGGPADWIHVSSEAGWEAVAVGIDQSCGLRDEGRLVCWGSDSVPEADARWLAVAGGTNHMCGLRADGVPECWRRSLDMTPPPPDLLVALSAGANAGAGIRTDGSLVQWESETEDAIGESQPGGRFDRISAAGRHACARREGGEWTCWGDEDPGAFPPEYAGWVELVAGQHWTCGIDSGSRLRCFGDGHVDGLDDATVEWAAIAEPEAGFHVCAIDAAGGLACRGSDDWRQSSSPQGRFAAAATGLFHSCGLLVDGRIACWGYGQIGEEIPP